MAESDILRHLLEMESVAASLVADAQTEADRRVSESEKNAQEAYQRRYGERVQELESEFSLAASEAAASYRSELESYRSRLDGTSTDPDAFRTIAERALFGEA